MAWTHPADTPPAPRRRGMLLGRLPDGTVTAYRAGAALLEREYTDDGMGRGHWTGSRRGRPDQPPAHLMPACRCGWRGTDVPYDADAGDHAGDDRNERSREAFDAWHRHADAALNPSLGDPDRGRLAQLAEVLRSLADERPRAALTLTRTLRELADLTEPLAVAAALTHNIAWRPSAPISASANRTSNSATGAPPASWKTASAPSPAQASPNSWPAHATAAPPPHPRHPQARHRDPHQLCGDQTGQRLK
ncbi:hypothetical protein [Streptomyces sp. NPDC059819]|uniref:hypothetical protein n=1 Tax=Streptomyces sp. NPDC059819 TaxID=3346963 RepID=UPI00365B9909